MVESFKKVNKSTKRGYKALKGGKKFQNKKKATKRGYKAWSWGSKLQVGVKSFKWGFKKGYKFPNGGGTKLQVAGT